MAKLLGIAVIVVMMVGGRAAAEPEPNPWRPVFFASLALTIGATAFWGVSYASMKSEADQIEATKPSGQPITQDDCNDRVDIVDDTGGHFDSACSWRSRSRTGSLLTVGFGVVTLASAYLAFVDRDAPSSSSNLAIAPTITPDGAGATLRLRW